MSEIVKGMEVRHRVSGERAIVVSVEAGTAKVSYDLGREARVDLVVLEPVDEDDGPLFIEPSL